MADSIPSNIGRYVPKFTKKVRRTEWYKLDNAATLFSLIDNDRSTNVFRISCTLKERIKIDTLQLSLNRIIERLPYFDVTIRNGVFWKYWESNKNTPLIYPETKYPCQRMNINSKGSFPFKVKAYYNRIAIEFHHSLTDGSGAMTFLRALVADYLSLRGVETNDWGDLFRYEQTPNPEEFDYAYKSNYNKEMPNPKVKGKAFKPPLTQVDKGVFHIITGHMSVKDILQVAPEKKISITDLLASVYLEALQEVLFNIPEDKRSKYLKPIRIAVPVNLRNYFPTKSMRNFTYMVSPEIDPKLGKHSFEEILKVAHHSLRKDISKRALSQHIARNVRGELENIARFAPLFLKKLFGKTIYENMGEKQNSGKLSNLGRITMPEAFAKEIENFEFVLAPSSVVTTGCAVISYQDKFIINFSRTTEEPEVEKFFFRKLAKLGIKIKIETN